MEKLTFWHPQQRPGEGEARPRGEVTDTTEGATGTTEARGTTTTPPTGEERVSRDHPPFSTCEQKRMIESFPSTKSAWERAAIRVQQLEPPS